jgi:uncharacterized protein DUF4349
MERSSDPSNLDAALRALRPKPPPAFAAEMDELAAKSFRRDPQFDSSPFAALTARLRNLTPQRLLFTTGGTAVAAVAIATVVIANTDSSRVPPEPEQRATNDTRPVRQKEGTEQAPVHEFSGEAVRPLSRSLEPSTESSAGSSAAQYSAEIPTPRPDTQFPTAGRAHRQIERSAEITLLAEPQDVAAASAEVFGAVHDVDGIVLRSTTTAGADAGARFELLIPTPKLGDALAAFSAIDEVRSRHEATADITAPTVALGERLQDSRAKTDGLLAQLASAETQSESEAIEIALRDERLHAAALRSRLDKLRQRADFSRVSLRIETGASTTESSDGSWGVGDALDDAGHILGIAAGVTVIAVAAIAPLALILLLAWLAHRAWLHRSRKRALDG